MSLEQIIDVIVNNGYTFSHNETLGNFEFSNNDEVISIYDTGNEKVTYCGHIKKDLKLSDRIYKCECGNIINRDFQASLNLKIYGENVLKQQSVT